MSWDSSLNPAWLTNGIDSMAEVYLVWVNPKAYSLTAIIEIGQMESREGIAEIV
jgi:hypothetical protein